MITLFLTIEVRAEKQRTNTPFIYIKLREQIITLFASYYRSNKKPKFLLHFVNLCQSKSWATIAHTRWFVMLNEQIEMSNDVFYEYYRDKNERSEEI